MFTDDGFTETLATNAFWMILGVVFATVILNTLLQRADTEREGRMDVRYLRMITAQLMTMLAAITVSTEPRPVLLRFRAVLEDDADFEETMHRWSEYVKSSRDEVH